MAREMQKANPGARRKALCLVVMATVIGIVLIAILDAHLETFQAWITEDPVLAVERLKIVFLVLSITSSGPLLGFTIYFWRLGARIIRSGRFPPPGQAVVRDTFILEGPPARRRGRLIQVIAGILGLLGCLFPVLFWHIIRLLE